ncbi:MAG: GTPase, partial [Frankiaceae bacterium]|nr:GTPase [Frankiaceae bacterium]
MTDSAAAAVHVDDERELAAERTSSPRDDASAPAEVRSLPVAGPGQAPRSRPALHDLEGEGFDLADRTALRRVAGLTTELEDVTEVEYRQLRLERVVLIGVWTSGTLPEAETSLQELKALAETAGSQVLEGLIQRRDKPDAATFVGSGKARELRD